MTRVAVVGATGRLGSVICSGVEAAADLTLVARVARSLDDGAYGAFATLEQALAVTDPDVVVEVTGPAAVAGNVRLALDGGVRVVAGATGIGDDVWDALGAVAQERGVALHRVPNFAIGAVLMMRFAAEAARHMPAIEIVEEHHDGKLDRPSGTAALTADRIEAAGAARPPIHSIRLPGLVAHQSVICGATAQTLTIRHDTTGREAFIDGALLAIRRVHALPPGLSVGLEAAFDR
jgi:4-hydroxy-tetrahydrodipicolinate reductase